MELFILYALLKLDALHTTATVMAIAGVIAAGLALIPFYTEEAHRVRNPEHRAWANLPYDERRKTPEPEEYTTVHIYKYAPYKLLLAVTLLSWFLMLGLPTTKQAAVLVAAHYTVEAAQSEEGQKLVKLLRLKANAYLDEQLKEVTK